MRRIRFTVVLLFAASVVTTALAAQTRQSVADNKMRVASTAQQSPGAGSEALRGAVAGVLVGALTEQFDGRAISVRLDKVDVIESSIRDRIVSGEGRMRIGDGGEDWIGFRFSTLYDTLMGSVAWPDISLGGIASGERQVPNDTALVRQLDDTVVGRLSEEFSSQSVRLQLDHISTVEAGTRYLRINATGIADFGRDGIAPTRIEGLYDRRDNVWLRVDYDLGPDPDRGDRNALAAGWHLPD